MYIIFLALTTHLKCHFLPFFQSSESVAYEWPSKPGLIRYYYHEDRRPDTRADVLSFGFISPLVNAVLLRIDSEASNDYLEVEIVREYGIPNKL